MLNQPTYQAQADFRIDDKNLKNRRHESRLHICVPCTFSVDEGPVTNAMTRDLASSGLAIKSSLRPKKGSKIQLLFNDYGAHTGQIVRVFEDGFAVSLPQSSLAVLALSGF